MKRYFIVGILVFIGFAIAFAPATIVSRALQEVPNTEMVNVSGTVWNGTGRLIADGHALGQVNWSFQYASLLRLSPGINWQLTDPGVDLEGTAAVTFTGNQINASGEFSAASVQPWLTPFDIFLQGNFELAPTEIFANSSGEASTLPRINGELRYQNGHVSYVLAGLSRQAQLPPMTVYFATDEAGTTTANAFATGSDIPLLVASPGAPGFLKIGITKHFTNLLNSPWPGSDPDHKIVLEVEEQLF